MAVNGGVLGTAVVIKPAIASQTLPSMTLRLQVFDLLGSIVYENQNAQSGADGNSYYFVWDGRNKSGRFVGTGVYRGVVTAIDESGTSSKAVTIGVKR
jgi:flagellar hook assembly protein FlgD